VEWGKTAALVSAQDKNALLDENKIIHRRLERSFGWTGAFANYTLANFIMGNKRRGPKEFHLSFCR
jgi:hypothetical protein